MTMTYTAPPARTSGIMIFIQAIASLLLRFALALPFWKSGLTRWEGFLTLRPATTYFYQEIYQPKIFGTTYTLPYPEALAWVASTAEIVLPAALVIGFATRLSALGLLAMSAVIFTVYPPEILTLPWATSTSDAFKALISQPWAAETLPWAAMALGLIAYGPGRISFDYFIARGFGRA